MLGKVTKYALVTLFAGVISACSVDPYFHGAAMRGQIVSVEGDEVVMCIGSNDGADVGQVLRVLEVVVHQGVVTEDIDSYELVPVGEVEISSIIDEHFARGTIVSGKVGSKNVVELGDR